MKIKIIIDNKRETHINVNSFEEIYEKCREVIVKYKLNKNILLKLNEYIINQINIEFKKQEIKENKVIINKSVERLYNTSLINKDKTMKKLKEKYNKEKSDTIFKDLNNLTNNFTNIYNTFNSEYINKLYKENKELEECTHKPYLISKYKRNYKSDIIRNNSLNNKKNLLNNSSKFYSNFNVDNRLYYLDINKRKAKKINSLANKYNKFYRYIDKSFSNISRNYSISNKFGNKTVKTYNNKSNLGYTIKRKKNNFFNTYKSNNYYNIKDNSNILIESSKCFDSLNNNNINNINNNNNNVSELKKDTSINIKSRNKNTKNHMYNIGMDNISSSKTLSNNNNHNTMYITSLSKNKALNLSNSYIIPSKTKGIITKALNNNHAQSLKNNNFKNLSNYGNSNNNTCSIKNIDNIIIHDNEYKYNNYINNEEYISNNKFKFLNDNINLLNNTTNNKINNNNVLNDRRFSLNESNKISMFNFKNKSNILNKNIQNIQPSLSINQIVSNNLNNKTNKSKKVVKNYNNFLYDNEKSNVFDKNNNYLKINKKHSLNLNNNINHNLILKNLNSKELTKNDKEDSNKTLHPIINEGLNSINRNYSEFIARSNNKIDTIANYNSTRIIKSNIISKKDMSFKNILNENNKLKHNNEDKFKCNSNIYEASFSYNNQNLISKSSNNKEKFSNVRKPTFSHSNSSLSPNMIFNNSNINVLNNKDKANYISNKNSYNKNECAISCDTSYKNNSYININSRNKTNNIHVNPSNSSNIILTSLRSKSKLISNSDIKDINNTGNIEHHLLNDNSYLSNLNILSAKKEKKNSVKTSITSFNNNKINNINMQFSKCNNNTNSNKNNNRNSNKYTSKTKKRNTIVCSNKDNFNKQYSIIASKTTKNNKLDRLNSSFNNDKICKTEKSNYKNLANKFINTDLNIPSLRPNILNNNNIGKLNYVITIIN